MRGQDNPLLDGPIPGQSLTSEPGNRPWENPPKMNTIEETIEFYMNRLSNPEMMNRMLDILEETDLPVTVLVEVLTMGGVMQGLHSVDLSVLVAPVLIEFIKGAAEQAGIDFELGIENKAKFNPELLRSVLSNMPDEDVIPLEDNLIEELGGEKPPQDNVDAEEPEAKSLMARRSA